MKLLISFICWILSMETVVVCQTLTVKSFALDPFDLTASTQRRHDKKGEACALVKVYFAKEGVEFLGNVVEKVSYDKSVYMVYMKRGSEKLDITLYDYPPLTVLFADYGIDNLQSLSTYILSIAISENETSKLEEILSTSDSKVFIEVSCPTQGASIYVNNMKVKSKSTSSGTMWYANIKPGIYNVEVRKSGFVSQQKSIDLIEKKEAFVRIPSLEIVSGSLEVDYTPIDAEVWIDGEKRGTSPNIFEHLSLGRHWLEIRMKGYATKKERVVINEGQTTSLTGNLVLLSNDLAPSLYQDMDIATLVSKAESGDAQSQYELGHRYINGNKGIDKDYAEAMNWSRLSAEQNNPYGQIQMGIIYEEGYGVSKNLSEAVKWYEKAAEQENGLGQYYLGNMYEKGKGVKKDIKKALVLYRKSAEQGCVDSQLALGWMYENGMGVQQSDFEAANWYRKAAELGNANAQYNLGMKYYNGYLKGRHLKFAFVKDAEEAFKWIKKSAEQDFVFAQYQLGFFYEKGIGTDMDIEEAKYWYQNAAELKNNNAIKALKRIELLELKTKAEQGDAEAQDKLGRCYLYGKGVELDLAKARYWLEKSAAQGNKNAIESLKDM